MDAVETILSYDDPFHEAPMAKPCAVFDRAASPDAPDTAVPFSRALMTPDPLVNENTFGVLVAAEKDESPAEFP